MTHEIISRCPVCDNKLLATKLKCSSCDTSIENTFSLSVYNHLTKDQLDFITTFVICRGSIKDVEKKLGISYPTVRAKLDNVIASLTNMGSNQIPKSNTLKKPVDSPTSSEILDLLDKGTLSTAEAINLLKKQ